MALRIQFRELLREHGLTPYHLAKRSEGRITLTTAYRLARLDGRVQSFDAAVCDALCETLGVEPGALFVREPGPAVRGARKAVRRRRHS
jgi:DNA-binding Xre family transcriptional regulator